MTEPPFDYRLTVRDDPPEVDLEFGPRIRANYPTDAEATVAVGHMLINVGHWLRDNAPPPTADN